MDFWVYVIFGSVALVALLGLFFAGVFWFELSKRKQISLRLKAVAKTLGGQCVEPQSPWQHPLIVVDNEGLRTRISLEQSKPGDGTGTSMLQVKKLVLVTDGYDPHLKLAVVPNSLSSKASTLFAGQRCLTGREDFDSKFVVASKQFQHDMADVISPDVARKVMEIGHFDPMSNTVGKDISKTEDASNADSVPFLPWQRKKQKLPIVAANLNAMVNQMNKHRFRLSFDGGKCELRLLVQESELDAMEEYVYTMIDIQRQVAANVSALQNSVVKKP